MTMYYPSSCSFGVGMVVLVLLARFPRQSTLMYTPISRMQQALTIQDKELGPRYFMQYPKTAGMIASPIVVPIMNNVVAPESLTKAIKQMLISTVNNLHFETIVGENGHTKGKDRAISITKHQRCRYQTSVVPVCNANQNDTGNETLH